MTSVTLRDVAKVFSGDTEVLEGFNLHIDAGELMVLLGPSGSGKSTILRLIAGLDQPTGGRVLFDGEDVTDVATRDRNVAMVQQEGALYSHLSARDNIRFPLARRKVPKPDSDREVEAGAAHLGIRSLLEKMPGELSDGHRHTVATARALIRDSRVLLLDEPLALLDAHIRGRARDEIVRLHRELGTTTLYVTNDQHEAMALGDRVAVLDETGTLRQVDPPLEIYRHPQSLFVADFVGELNHTTVRLEHDGRGWWLPLGNDRCSLPPSVLEAWPRLEGYGKQEIVVGIRPEHLAIAPPGTPFASCLHGTVSRVADVGSYADVWTSVGDWQVKARLSGERPPVSGDLIELAIDSRHLHFFEPGRGERI
jgi:ABC-type sugar transport system ATPase subunit